MVLFRLIRPQPLLQCVPRISPAASLAFSSSPCVANPAAPTFSSTGDTKSLVTQLGLSKIGHVIIRGKVNIPFPKSYNVNIEEFLPGAIGAAGLVTKAASQGNWEELEGLVDPACIQGLKSNLENYSQPLRDLIALDPEDVFLSFIANDVDCQEGNNLQVVTFSFPGFSKLQRVQGVVNQRMAELKEMKELNNERLKEIIAEVREENSIDPQAIFNDNEILIGNYRLERQNSDSQWTVTEVGQANMRDSMQAYFRFRWRGRLGIHLKMDKPFLTVLRADYFTDWIALMIFSTFFFGAPGMR